MKAEEEILKMLGKNEFIVEGGISRLQSLQVTADDLLHSDLCIVQCLDDPCLSTSQLHICGRENGQKTSQEL